MTDEALLERERPRLFALAYRMLGEGAEADDIVQEANLRFLREEPRPEHPGAWLRTVVTRLCIDRLRQLKRRREAYFGPWVPEPLAPEVPDPAELADSLSVAFLLLLEKLSPAERAVFLLRKVFAHEYTAIAEVLGKSEGACRQLFSRARSRLEGARSRFAPDPEQGERLRMAFLAACAQGDTAGLEAVLHRDVVLYSDGGGKVSAASRPLFGSGKVAYFIASVLKHQPEDARFALCTLNRMPAVAMFSGEKLLTLLCLDVEGDAIAGLYSLRNPERLGGLEKALG